MQVSVESGQGLEKRLIVDLPAERVDAEVDKKLQSLARSVRMDGFRPGKVPMRVIRQRFGGQARQEVYGDLIQATFYEAVSQQQLHPAGEPNIELRDTGDQGGFGYIATFEVLPEIKLADVGTLKILRTLAEVQDTDVDAMVEKLRRQRTIWNEVEREAEEGDTVHVDFNGTVGGEPFEGGSAQDVPLVLGSGAMIDGFEDGLIGARAGETRNLELRFPDDYRAEHLAGKDVSFEVVVKKVSEPELPALDEEFVKQFGVEDGTLETLRGEIRANMERELHMRLDATNKERILDALLAANDITVPRVMLEEESKRLKQQAQNEMAQSGRSSNLDLPLSMFESQAERRVKLGMLLSELIREQNLQVDRNRVRQLIEEFAASYESPEEVISYYYNDKEQLAAVENRVLEDQVVDWILDKADVSEESRSFDEVMGPSA